MSAPGKLGIAATVAVLLAVSALLFLRSAGAPPEELAALLGQGGERMLREPMRAAGGGPRVLVFALDGVGDHELREAIAAGGAPRMATLLGARSADESLHDHGYAVPGVLSILPSTTLAAWSSIFTGEPAGRTGVPGNEWFAREEMRFYAPAPVTVSEVEHALEVYTDDLMGRALRVPTVYERAGVRSYVSLSQIHRGADLLTTPDARLLGELIVATAQEIGSGEEVGSDPYAKLDGSAVRSLLESIREHGLADLQVVYFPGVDLFTHAAESPIPDQLTYLREVIDPAVGAILDAYEAREALDETYVIFVSDHGHTPVIADDRHALGTGGGGEPPDILELAGFRPRLFELNPAAEDFQAVLAYQGAIAYVYLADRSTCPAAGTRCDWIRAPRLEEDVLPVVRAFDAANRTGAGVPQLRGTLDLIFAREPRPPGEDALPFRVWDGERLVDIGAFLAANPRPDLLELEERLAGLATGPYGHRAGDVLLLARSGTERPIEERFYFSDQYRSWHGSPTGQDSRIPLIVARRGSTGVELRERVRELVGERPTQLSVTPLILGLLDGQAETRCAAAPGTGWSPRAWRISPETSPPSLRAQAT